MDTLVKTVKNIITDTAEMLEGSITVAELRELGADTPYESASWVHLHYNFIVQTVILRARRGLKYMNFPIEIYNGFIPYPKKGTMSSTDIRLLENKCRQKFPDATIKFNVVDSGLIDITVEW
jgi:hypothetical protein